jgi:hypothetical protein
MFLITYYALKIATFPHLGGKDDVLVDSCGMRVFSGSWKKGRSILFVNLSIKIEVGYFFASENRSKK